MAARAASAKEEQEKQTRIAIVNSDRCKPKKCRQECKRSCPVVRIGKECIVVEPDSKIAIISETLCIGCGICVKKCPFEAIQIINLPSNLAESTTHRYGPNSFKLHRCAFFDLHFAPSNVQYLSFIPSLCFIFCVMCCSVVCRRRGVAKCWDS